MQLLEKLTGTISKAWLAVVLASLIAATSAMAQEISAGETNDPLMTPVFSDGRRGPLPAALPEAAVAALRQPNPGTGVLTSELQAESWRGYIPSPQEIARLQPASGKVGIETVIGLDTRFRTYTTTYPARATALITFTGGWCTGWFNGPNTVVTAGHCVHSGGTGGSWRSNVRVWPGFDAGSAPFGSYPAKWLASVVGWVVNANEQYDYGVVKLNVNAGNTVGWYGFWWQSASLTGLPSVIAGYPGDKSPLQSQWLSVDQVRVTQANQVFYKNDTFGGMSGSAVWQDRPPGSSFCSDGPCAYAIHAYGLHGGSPHSTHNHGTRITQAVFNNLVFWKTQP
jgi:glutamyl endopeptidase